MVRTRPLIATGLSLAAAVCMRSWSGPLPLALFIPAGLLAAAALLVHHRRLDSQLLVRAVWWSNLILATVIAAASSRSDAKIAGLLAMAVGGALLTVGRVGLDEPGGAFAPIAFRSTLLAILVMALADAQSLILIGTLSLGERPEGQGLMLYGCALLLLLGIVGVYRLRLWGLVLNLAANGLVLWIVLCGAFDLDYVLRLMYGVTAGLQLLISVPLVIALVRGAPPGEARISTVKAALGATAVVALMALTLYCAYIRQTRLL